jgi:hypothetical protein
MGVALEEGDYCISISLKIPDLFSNGGGVEVYLYVNKL